MEKKKYEELTFTDDFMFCKVLMTNPKLCKEILELLLDIKIKNIVIAETQKSMELTYDGKGVRFDVYVEDAADTVYDIEMQTTIQKDLPKRMRYYQGMIDLNLIQAGEKYSKLRRTYIIFICTESPFKKSNLPVYTFRNRCEQDNSIYLGDEVTKVIINASGERTGLSPEMRAFLDFIRDDTADSELTRNLKKVVGKVVKKREWEVEYMTLQMKLMEEREEGREEGGIYMLIKTGIKYKVPQEKIVEDIMSEYNYTREEAEEKLAEYQEI